MTSGRPTKRQERRARKRGEPDPVVSDAAAVASPPPPPPAQAAPPPLSPTPDDEAASDAEHVNELASDGWPSRHPIVVGRPTPEFEPTTVDPVHRRHPYRPDTAIDGWSTDAFTVRAASLRGHLHRYNGAPRQDDLAVAVGPRTDQILVAVADGVSAAPQSHIGAATAVRYAIQWLEASLAQSMTSDTDWKSLAESTAWALIEQAGAVLGSDGTTAEEAEQLLATTLVVAVVNGNDDGTATAHVIGVGDSGAWVLSDNGFRRVEGGKAEIEGGLSSSAVSGLPRVPNADIVASTCDLAPGEVLLLGTDGFGDPLGTGDGEVGTLFRSILQPGPPPLLEFAHALDFSRETFDDDRTLVAVWPRDRVPAAP